MNRLRMAFAFCFVVLIPFQLSGGLIGLSSRSFSGPGSLYSISSSTGLATKIAQLQAPAASTSIVGFEILGGTGYATDVFMMVDNVNTPVYGSVDLLTGAFTVLGQQKNGTGGLDYNWQALAGDADTGTLYMASNGGEFHTIDTATGTDTFRGFLKLSGTEITAFGMAGMAFDQANKILYGVVSASTYSTLYTIDPANVVATELGTFDLGTGGMVGLAFDPTDGMLYMNTGWDPNGYRLFKLNPSTLAWSQIGSNSADAWTDGNGIDGLAYMGDSNVPEPGTLAAMGTALLGLAALGYRRARK